MWPPTPYKLSANSFIGSVDPREYGGTLGHTVLGQLAGILVEAFSAVGDLSSRCPTWGEREAWEDRRTGQSRWGGRGFAAGRQVRVARVTACFFHLMPFHAERGRRKRS